MIELLFRRGSFCGAGVTGGQMDRAAEVMLGIIRKEICGSAETAGELGAGLSAETVAELYALTRAQELTALVGNGLRRCGLLSGDSISGNFKRAIYMAVCRCELQTAEITAVSEVFEAEKIPFILLKGAVLRGLYPEPWMRTSCDVDILIKKDDLLRASRILMDRLGYTKLCSTPHDVSFNNGKKINIELHFSLIENNRIGSVDVPLLAVWEYSAPVGGGYERRMTDEMFYYYHIAHMAKHITTGGFGVRPFIDLWLLQSKADFDASKAEELIKAGGLSAFNDAVVRLSGVWFGELEHNNVTLGLQDYILNAGIYGNMENITAVNQIRTGGKLRSILKRVFLPFASLVHFYPVLHRHKWLFPFCQLHRLVSFLFNGRLKKGIYEIKTNAALTAEKRSAVASLLEQIGL